MTHLDVYLLHGVKHGMPLSLTQMSEQEVTAVRHQPTNSNGEWCAMVGGGEMLTCKQKWKIPCTSET